MKRLLLSTLLTLFLLPCTNYSQHLESILVNAAETPPGNAGGASLVWTLGELMVEYYANGPVLDQGFLQCQDLLTPVREPGRAEDAGWRLSVWPNPTGAGQLNLQTTAALHIVLFDNLGRVLKRVRCSNETIRLDVSSWPAGSYWLQAMDEDGRSRVLQFQKL